MFSVFSCLGSQEIHQLEVQKCESEVINLSCYVMDITDLTWGQNPVTVGLSTKLCSFFDGMNLINLHDSHFEPVLNGRTQDITTIVFTILGTNFLFHQILVRPRRHVVAFEGACHHSGRSTESSAVSKKLRGSHFIFPKNDPTIYLILILNPVGKQVNEDKSGVALWISFSSIPMFKTFHNFWNVLKIIWKFHGISTFTFLFSMEGTGINLWFNHSPSPACLRNFICGYWSWNLYFLPPVQEIFVGFPVVFLQKKTTNWLMFPGNFYNGWHFWRGRCFTGSSSRTVQGNSFFKKIVPFKGTTSLYTKIGWKFLEYHFLNVTFL